MFFVKMFQIPQMFLPETFQIPQMFYILIGMREVQTPKRVLSWQLSFIH